MKFIFDFDKWKLDLCEFNYCFDKLWLCKFCGFSFIVGFLSFRICGFYCEFNCVKCLMMFYKIRVYDVLDVIILILELVLKEK